jgi:imidazolonepropionase-like amidohydrolase
MDEQKAAGYDFLKIYDGVSREVFDAVAAYSKEIDFPFAGHVPIDVPLDVAMRSGMASIEHLMEWDRATAVPGSPLEAALDTRVWTEQLRNMAVVARQVSAGALSTERLFDADRRRAMAELAAETGIWNVPTVNLPRQAMPSRRQAAVQRARPEMRLVAPAELDLWSDPSFDTRFVALSDEDREALQVFLFDEYLRRVKVLHDAGAGLLVGSDSPNPFVLYGVAVHQELAFFVEAGLSPYDALVAATRAPAEFLKDDSFGTIEEGNVADLVLLDANPLADIAATAAISGVALRGRWLPRTELDAMLEAIVASFSTSGD